MQRSRARLSFPGSSRSSLGSSGTSSGASLGLRSEQGDELELYLSLVAGNSGRRKEERRGSANVDWSKLLDGQNEASEEEDSVETEGDGDVLQFLKPKSQPKENSEQDAGRSKDTSDTFELSDKSSDKVAASYLKTRPPHTDITDTDSISVTDDSISSPRKSRGIHRDIANAGARRKAAEPQARSPEKSKSMDHGKPSASSATRPQRVSQESSTTSTEEDTSEFSVQELGLSSQFRNILTLEELEAINSSNPDQNTTTGIVAEESGEASCHSEERSRLHNIVSLADLDSLPAESRTALPGREVANPEVIPQYGHYTDTQQEDHHSTTQQEHYYTESGTSSSEVQKVREKAGMSEDTHTLLSYEEDFEDETLKSATISHSRGRNNEENTGTNSASELGPEYSSLWDQTNSETTAGKSESTEAAVGGGDQVSAEGPTHKAKDTVLEGTFKPNLKGSDEPCVPVTPATQPLPDLPDLPEFPNHTPLLPHLLTTHTHTSALFACSYASEALEDLVHSQLLLTRSLVARSRSMAQHLANSITSDYHYTTLEETKKFISQHRPRVLTTEEAKQLVSQEENI